MKTCSKCGEEKPNADFWKDASKKCGIKSYCKVCATKYNKQWYDSNKESVAVWGKSYYKLNKEAKDKYNKQYHEDNKDAATTRMKLYREANKNTVATQRKLHYEANKEAVAAQGRLYYKLNKEDTVARVKLYYEANKEVVADYNKQWRKNNPDKERISHQRRQSRKLALPATLTPEEWKLIKDTFGNKCCYCGKEGPLAQDHFVALSKGGEYTVSNIVPSCKSCNSMKRNTSFFIWYPVSRHYSKQREQKILKYLNYKNETQQFSLAF